MYPYRDGPSEISKENFICLSVSFSLAVAVVAVMLRRKFNFSHMLSKNSTNQLYSTQSE